jgi:hypothetical protein
MATPISPAMLNFYLERGRENGGERGFRAAQYLLATMDTTPLDFQRTLIHSRLGRNRLWPYPQLPKRPTGSPCGMILFHSSVAPQNGYG